MWRAPLPLLEVTSTDHADARVVTISLQQLGAKRKEGFVRKTIVFKDDRFFDLLKNPIETAGHAPFAAEVIVGEISEQLAGPVNTVYDSTGSQAQLPLALAIRAGAIGDNQQFCRSRFGDFGENARGPIYSIKDEKGDRSFQVQFLL